MTEMLMSADGVSNTDAAMESSQLSSKKDLSNSNSVRLNSAKEQIYIYYLIYSFALAWIFLIYITLQQRSC